MPNRKYDLSINEHIKLIIEQGKIERIALLTEIKDLRDRLSFYGISDNDISSWVENSDDLMDKLLRYELGYCGKLFKSKKFFLPYTFRRRTRKKL
ncbi:hypothetical protein [Dryocola clanedunensis]